MNVCLAYFSTAIMALATVLASAHLFAADPDPGVTKVPVVFSGGHDTVGVDRGRPVVLIAAALGVPDEVFREAFSHVRPASGGREPEPEQVRANKSALMAALGKHGVTNDRLDEVSNFYRYPPGRGGLWKNKPAVANALVKDGTIIGYEVVDGGAGYSSAPAVSVPGLKTGEVKVTLSYGKDLEKNGAVSAIAASDAKVK